jgi:general secretion pathway protein F
MPEFTYEALATTGQKQQGSLQAGSDREALSMLSSRGLYPLRLVAVQQARSWSFGGKSVRKSLLCAFFSQLADLIHSGVPLLRSIEILERQTSHATFKEVLRDVRARVADGTGLAQSMGQHPTIFDELAVSMVRAGQEGGFLEDVLRRIADFTEHQEDLKAKVVGAMAYPVFLGVVGTIILLGLVIFFVPRFEPIFKKLEEKDELPLLTEVVIGISHMLINYGIFVLIGGAGLVYLFRRWARTESGRLTLDTLRLKMPLAGTIFLNLALSRFTRILGTMLHNGIPILQALRIAKDSTGNRVLADAINKSAENIKAGDSLAKPFSASKHFPRDVVEMVSIGEESNSLEKVLIDIANSLEKRTSRQLELFVRLLEPMMLLVMAIMTLLVVASLLLPVFKMSSTIG